MKEVKDMEIWDEYAVAKPKESAQQVGRKMAGDEVLVTVVTNEDGTPLGIISGTEMEGLIIDGKNPETTCAEEIMVSVPTCLSPKDSLEEAFSIMAENRKPVIPVVNEDGVLEGVVTINDLMNELK